ncbi:PAS domain S-box protein [Algibacter amylolyticus]|uniref:histidine kinase n=1 Tax=Algibacter amylolyticus TaxID=1608400 RepID=A0A5M7B480_9FLAO|nr:HAMP domain-containing sensor histidine kinase [Algibacter amylolyticus]KAA5824202.1 PAS domain S-box protein [Algibacter amylolyticus]MBB5269762.1 PAS domain S-box-containing protein [Algibacter amylolyticus]TSJ74679.1 PAS domain S-box protein [Algibacter amylolyticus]
MPDRISVVKEQLFKNIFDFANGGLAIVSLKGKWVKVNDSLATYLGYSKEELYKLSFQQITHKKDLNIDLENMRLLIKGEIDKYQIEKRYFHKNGNIVWALISVSLLRDDHGEPIYFIAQILDITSSKESKSQLKILLELAQEQNNRLTNFADIVTHNLKTHTSNLSTLVSFLEEEAHDLVQDENFELLKGSVINLTQTVSHLTEIAKIKSVDENKIEALNLYTFVSQAIYNISAIAKNKNCVIENHVDKDHLINAIPAYLDSIILNFLSNAIKYRDQTRDTVIKLSSQIENDHVAFHIEDNGLGIDLDKFGDSLFQMYKTFHYNDDALGIGLFITKAHIEALGGHVKVKSEVGIGTVFSVCFKRPTTFVLESNTSGLK